MKISTLTREDLELNLKALKEGDRLKWDDDENEDAKKRDRATAEMNVSRTQYTDEDDADETAAVDESAFGDLVNDNLTGNCLFYSYTHTHEYLTHTYRTETDNR